MTNFEKNALCKRQSVYSEKYSKVLIRNDGAAMKCLTSTHEGKGFRGIDGKRVKIRATFRPVLQGCDKGA